MKKLYFSTFVEGLEKPIEAMLHKEGGVAVERVLSGAALYRSVREPALPYVHQTFQVLFQMKPMANVNDAVRRLLATGGWFDRFPYEETQGKKFRIVTAQDDHLVSANMRYVDMLETAICEHTGMPRTVNARKWSCGCFAVRKPPISCGGSANVRPNRKVSSAQTSAQFRHSLRIAAQRMRLFWHARAARYPQRSKLPACAL